jgi:hypothetical protein
MYSYRTVPFPDAAWRGTVYRELRELPSGDGMFSIKATTCESFVGQDRGTVGSLARGMVPIRGRDGLYERVWRQMDVRQPRYVHPA